MIVLDTVTKKLEVVLGAAKSTNDMPATATWVDVTTTTYTPASRDTATNGVTAVGLVFAPGASIVRQVKLLTVHNADSASKLVTVRLNNNATTRILVSVTLAVGSTLFYTDGEGFRVMDTAGVIL